MTTPLDIAASSPFDLFQPQRVKEARRRSETGDDKFWRSFLYFFELEVPSRALDPPGMGDTTSMLFPLVINPQAIVTTEPFSVAATPTVDAGLFVEENGIIAHTIRIAGHTGFSPKANLGAGAASDFLVGEAGKIVRGTWTPLALSGQKHFQFLQDRVFRVYSELKKDADLAHDTKLYFHNVKDDEHWRVIPIRFDMQRTVQERFLYRYTIELLAVEPAAEKEIVIAGEDKSWFSDVSDAINEVKSAFAIATGVINEIAQTVDELERAVRGALSIINDALSVLSSVADLVNGVADLIAMPLNTVAGVVSGIDSVLERMVDLPGQFRDTVMNSWRRLGDSFDRLGIHKDLYSRPITADLTLLEDQASISSTSSSQSLASSEANPVTELRKYSRLGSGPVSSDRATADAQRRRTGRMPDFKSSVRRIVDASDSLPSLAAKHLGNARYWRAIAILNRLQPPYISTTGLPGTLKPGDEIAIPSVSLPQRTRPGAGILGPSPLSSLEDQLLGVDLRIGLVPGTSDRYGLVLQAGTSPSDVMLVRGIDNLKQAIRTRLTIEQGTSPLYRRLGHKRLVGVGVRSVDDEIVRIRLKEALTADPRIAAVTAIRLNSTVSPDIVDADIDVAVRGLSQSVALAAPVRV